MCDFLSSDRVRPHRYYAGGTESRPNPTKAFIAEGLTNFGTTPQEIAPERAATIARAKARYREIRGEILDIRRIIADEYLVLIADTTTADQARFLYGQAGFAKTRSLALRRWVELTDSAHELREVYNLSRKFCALGNPALEKWEMLARTIVEHANTFREALSALESSPEDGHLVEIHCNCAQSLAVEKCLSLCTTTKDVKAVDDRIHHYRKWVYTESISRRRDQLSRN